MDLEAKAESTGGRTGRKRKEKSRPASQTLSLLQKEKENVISFITQAAL